MYTTHGHHIRGTEKDSEPPVRARCGGPSLCHLCATEVAQVQISLSEADKSPDSEDPTYLERIDLDSMGFEQGEWTRMTNRHFLHTWANYVLGVNEEVEIRFNRNHPALSFKIRKRLT